MMKSFNSSPQDILFLLRRVRLCRLRPSDLKTVRARLRNRAGERALDSALLDACLRKLEEAELGKRCQMWNAECFGEILSRDDLMLPEEDVFKYVEQWPCAKAGVREKHAPRGSEPFHARRSPFSRMSLQGWQESKSEEGGESKVTTAVPQEEKHNEDILTRGCAKGLS
eukprot:Polyplicarium_translucidae@DN2606_c0_g1_i10.p1